MACIPPNPSYQMPTCYVVNKMNGKVLDVEYGEAAEGNPVLMWEKKTPPCANQLWTVQLCGHDETFYIVSSLDADFVLTFKENPNTCGFYATVCRRMSPPNPCQMFRWYEDHIGSLLCDNYCVDIECAKTCDGALVVAGLISGLVSQHWTVEPCDIGSFQPPEPTPLREPRGFLIENGFVDRVFTVAADRISEGVHVISGPKAEPPVPGQMWKMVDAENAAGFYHVVSMMDPNFVLDVEQGNPNAVGQHLIVWPKKTPAAANQLFRWNRNLLESALNPNLVVDVADDEEAKLKTAYVGDEPGKSWNMVPIL